MTRPVLLDVERRRRPPSPLMVVADLFDRLHAAEVRYCHWKSNEHLDASMAGATDLDLLVDRRDVAAFAHVAGAAGYKRFVARIGRGYAGIEDYLGFDPASGKLVHLHVHYQLTLGERYLKGYRLPWEDVCLETRRLDDAFGVHVADPHLETLILLVRAALKLRWRDRLALRRTRPALPGPALRELRWLAERTDTGRLRAVARPLVGEHAAALLVRLAKGPAPTRADLYALLRSAEPAFGEYRLYRPPAAALRLWTRELTARWSALRARHLGGTSHARRVAPHGGAHIAIVGADGAGKSTLTGEVIGWLARDLAVIGTYGGSGQGPASPLRRVLRRVARLVRPLLGRGGAPRAPLPAPASPPARPDGPALPPDASPSAVRLAGRVTMALALAREQRRNAMRARRARARGVVVVSDRLPQRQFAGLNDGPRLTAWRDAGPAPLRWAARVEDAAFRSMAAAPPDLVIKLRVAPEVALRRKPDTPPAQLYRKTEIIGELRFPPATRVVDVDANRPLEQVLLSVKRAVWESL